MFKSKTVMALGAAFVLVFGQPYGVEAAPQGIQGQMNRLAINALPVFPWLVVGATKEQQVLTYLRSMGVSALPGVFAHTGGPLINVVTFAGEGFAGETGLRIVSMGFEQNNRLASVVFLVDRGYQDKNLDPLLQRMNARYAAHAQPIMVGDTRGESADRYVLYDLGRYTVELAIPEHGQRFKVTFATRKLYEEMKIANGTANLLLPNLAPHN